MKKWLAVVLLLCAGVAKGQTPPGAYGPGTGGSSSPSSLPNFFNGTGGFGGFMGLSPQDFGAKGDGRQAVDGVLTSGSAVVTSATFAFCNGGSVACTTGRTSDVGKVFEGVCGPSFKGTVLSVQSATQITLTATQSTCNTTGVRIGTWTDDTAALQSWVTAGIAVGVVHNFYIPKGNYYTTKPLRFVNPNSTQECSAVTNGGGGFITCALELIGAGSTSAIIHPATGANFLWTTGSAADNGVVYVSGYSFGSVFGFGIIGDGVSYSASGVANFAAGLYMVSTSHFIVSQMWIQQIVGPSAAPSFEGLYDAGCFECTFYNNAIEGNGAYNVRTNLAEKETYDTVFMEGLDASGAYNLAIGGTNIKQARFRNINLQNAATETAAIVFLPNTTIQAGESFIFDGIRANSGGSSDLGIVFQSGCAGQIEFDSPTLTNSTNSATSNLLWNQSGSTCTISVNGGILNAGGGTGIAIKNDAAGQNFYLSNTAAITGALAGTNAASIFGIVQTATGWGGLGGIAGTYFLGNQGTVFANGNISVGAGWGTSATAAVCATPPPGFSQSDCFTITSGSAAFAAAPTVTITLPNALPASTVPCTLDVVDITGAGGAIMWKQTTNSATAPVFTAKTNTGAAFTPAVTETYTMILRCGP